MKKGVWIGEELYLTGLGDSLAVGEHGNGHVTADPSDLISGCCHAGNLLGTGHSIIEFPYLSKCPTRHGRKLYVEQKVRSHA